MNQNDIDFLESEARRLIAACRSVSMDGTPIYSPDASGHFVGTWIRDFAYMVEGVPDAVPQNELAAIIETMLRGQLDDGTLPNKYMASGRFAYLVKGCGSKPPTDNPQYLIRLVYEHWKQSGDLSLFIRHSHALECALDSLPLDDSEHLVWIDPQNPHPGYGFTDAIAKTGCELFSSLLLCEAHKLMEELHRAAMCEEDAERHVRLASLTRSALTTLWDENTGAFLAATDACRQIDIWGSAYAVKRGIATVDQAQSISRFLVDRYHDYVKDGMVRHVIEPGGWEKLLCPIEIGSSQNGGYWGVPCGWIAKAIAVTNPQLACDLLRSMIHTGRTHGVHEWISDTEKNNPDYVACAALPLPDAIDLLTVCQTPVISHA
jgi:hypothetical protein